MACAEEAGEQPLTVAEMISTIPALNTTNTKENETEMDLAMVGIQTNLSGEQQVHGHKPKDVACPGQFLAIIGYFFQKGTSP